MLEQILDHIHNYFDVYRCRDHYRIVNGALTNVSFLQNGQYFKVVGSVFNDGVYQYPANSLVDEEFDGEVWAMAVPPAVIALSEQIEAWQNKYGTVDSPAMSPFNSESFGGYSYSKGGASVGGGNPSTWENTFSGALNRWRKI